MKYLTCMLIVGIQLTAWGHDHIEVGLGSNSTLTTIGRLQQLATFFPVGEAPSSSVPRFPGGTYATELTFSAFDTSSPPPLGAIVRVKLLAVTGPTGGAFSFWETDASSATWTRPTGWTASPPATEPAIFASEDSSGYGHIHGRVFTFSKAGNYTLTFVAEDAEGNYAASAPFALQFTVIEPPQLAIGVANSSISLTFPSRDGLIYDVQSSTTLQPGSWTTIGTLDGDGSSQQFLDSLNNRPRLFYRLVEYQ